MENNETSKIRKVLRNEIAWFLGFVVLVAGFISSYMDLKYDIKTIKENHLIHIEQQLKDNLADDKARTKMNADNIQKVCEKVDNINLKLEKLISILEAKGVK